MAPFIVPKPDTLFRAECLVCHEDIAFTSQDVHTWGKETKPTERGFYLACPQTDCATLQNKIPLPRDPSKWTLFEGFKVVKEESEAGKFEPVKFEEKLVPKVEDDKHSDFSRAYRGSDAAGSAIAKGFFIDVACTKCGVYVPTECTCTEPTTGSYAELYPTPPARTKSNELSPKLNVLVGGKIPRSYKQLITGECDDCNKLPCICARAERIAEIKMRQEMAWRNFTILPEGVREDDDDALSVAGSVKDMMEKFDTDKPDAKLFTISSDQFKPTADLLHKTDLAKKLEGDMEKAEKIGSVFDWNCNNCLLPLPKCTCSL